MNLKSQQFKRINTRFAAGDVAVDLFDEGQAEVREVCSKPTARVAQQQQKRCLPLTNHKYTRANVGGGRQIVKMINKDNIPRFQRSFGNTVPVALRLYDEIAAMQKLYVLVVV